MFYTLTTVASALSVTILGPISILLIPKVFTVTSVQLWQKTSMQFSVKSFLWDYERKGNPKLVCF